MKRAKQRELIEEQKQMRETIQQVPISLVDLNFLYNLIFPHKFVDPYFPPNSYSLNGMSKHTLDCSVTWLRPEEFIGTSYQVFEGGIEHSDINQGQLGDCWFMSALASITDASSYVTRLFESPEVSRIGLYRISLYKNGEWTSVIVDDLIPCSGDVPVFGKNNGAEIWVVLLEKAYAKLHGSYMSLKGGFAAEAFMDITGSPAFSYYFDEYERDIQSGVFWNWLEQWTARGFALTAATENEANKRVGLVSGHYYSLVRVANTHGHQLLHLRNPWGSFEWKGDWSDQSDMWTPALKRQLDVHFDRNDGAFWISYQDFLHFFGRVVVGKIGYPHDFRARCLISKDASTGGMSRFMYSLQVSYQTEVIIGLHQDDERSEGVEEYRRYLDIGLVLLRYDGSQYSFVDATPKNKTERDVFLECVLDPGWYLIIPISGGCSFNPPNNASPINFSLLTEEGSLHPLFQSTIRDVFRRFDHDLSQTIGPNEFLEFSRKLGKEIDTTQFYNVICNKYTSTQAGIILQGLYELFITAIHDNNSESTVRDWLVSLGYNRDMYSIEERALVLSVHSMVPVYTEKAAIDPYLNNLAWGLAAEHRGKKEKTIENIDLYLLRSTSGVSFVAKNTERTPQKFTLDMRGSSNVEYSVSQGKTSLQVPAAGYAVMQHIQCLKTESRYSYSMSMRLG